MNMWVCLDETGPGFQLAGTLHGIGAISKPVRMVTMRKSDKEKIARRALVTSDTDDVCVLNELTESEDTAMEAEPEDDEDEFFGGTHRVESESRASQQPNSEGQR